jgi:thiosulfate dehydrogenase (quinone) large subunit
MSPLVHGIGSMPKTNLNVEPNAQPLARNLNRTWVVRNVSWLKSFIRIILGIVWLIDGYLKFSPGFVDSFPALIKSEGQPSWLQPWFNFWSSITSANAAPFVYSFGVLEVALGTALVLGLMRKIAYLGGMVLSLLIWAIPEGFGGPYGPGSTDIGTGIVYSFLFLSLIIINTISGPSRYSMDFMLERKYQFWKRVAEFGQKE